MTSIDIVIPVYKPGSYFKKILTALSEQIVDHDIVHRVYIVDDGNNDTALIQCIREFKDFVLLTHTKNTGRAKALNYGASFGKGQFILFLDADCEIEGTNLFNQHYKVLLSGYDVSYGSTKPQIMQSGFWKDYLEKVEIKREKSINKGNFLNLTSNNIAIKRALFEKVGGFDEKYKGYGFEDRDLIAKLIQQNAKINFDPKLVVRHDVDFDLCDVTRKMEEAGTLTSTVFAENHPEQYRKLPYYYFDLRYHPVALKIPFLFSVVFLPSFVKFIDRFLLKKHLFTPMSVFLVKLVSAMAFLKGTGRCSTRI